MKKIKYYFFVLLFLISGQLLAQTSYSRSALVAEINAKINANHANKITGDTLNHVLRHMLDSYCNLVSDSCANGYANFANTDLTFNGNRYHNANGKVLHLFNGLQYDFITGDTTFALGAAEFYMDTTNDISFYIQNQSGNASMFLYPGSNAFLSCVSGSQSSSLSIAPSLINNSVNSLVTIESQNVSGTDIEIKIGDVTNAINNTYISVSDSLKTITLNGLTKIKSGGTGTLSSGVDTVFTSDVTANSHFFLSYYKGTISSPGVIYEDASLRSAGTYFIIKSSSGSDASTYNWMFLEQ